MKTRLARRLRCLCFDLENRPSAYWYEDKTTAEITAIGWKWADEPEPRTLLLTSDGGFVGDDDRVVPAPVAYVIFRDQLCQAGIVYGHNIRRHDLPLFQAGLLRLELPPLPPLVTQDTCRDLPKRKDLPVSLANLASLYGLPGEKFGMTQAMWEQANRLEPDGLVNTRKRVVGDVLLQEALRARLLDLHLLSCPKEWAP